MEYLESMGVLTHGNPEEIANAKLEYKKIYQRKYKQLYRNRHREVRFTVDHSTHKALDLAAKEFDLCPSAFARQATLERLRERPTGTSPNISRELLQKVAIIHSEVRHLCRKRPSGFLERRITFERLAQRIGALEEVLRQILRKHQ